MPGPWSARELLRRVHLTCSQSPPMPIRQMSKVRLKEVGSCQGHFSEIKLCLPDTEASGLPIPPGNQSTVWQAMG